MDVFFEQLVKKHSTTSDKLKRVGLIVATLLVCFIVAVVLPSISTFFNLIWPLLAAGALYGSWYLMGEMDIEYEYILTNGEMDIDKVIHQRKRKRLVTVDVRNFTELGKYKENAEALSHQNFSSKVEAARDQDAEDCWYAVLEHASYGHMLLLFSPNDHIMDGCKEYLKRGVLKA